MLGGSFKARILDWGVASLPHPRPGMSVTSGGVFGRQCREVEAREAARQPT